MTLTEIAAFAHEPLTFTSRASYLLWRAQWRQHYADLSASIRHQRGKAASLSKAGEYAGNHQANAVMQGGYAFKLLELRALSKLRAQEQFLLERAAKTDALSAA